MAKVSVKPKMNTMGILRNTMNPDAITPIMGFNMTSPALIALIAYIIMGLVIILPFEFPIVDQETGEEYIVKYHLGQRVLVLLLISIPIGLSVYTINCLVAGKCVVWSYIISVLTVFWIALFIISAFIYTLGKKNRANRGRNDIEHIKQEGFK